MSYSPPSWELGVSDSLLSTLGGAKPLSVTSLSRGSWVFSSSQTQAKKIRVVLSPGIPRSARLYPARQVSECHCGYLGNKSNISLTLKSLFTGVFVDGYKVVGDIGIC